MKTLMYILTVLVMFSTTSMAQIYVSLSGDDLANNGSFDQPYKSIVKAISVSVVGDTIFVRGGVYTMTGTITISTSKSGTSSSRCFLLAYPGDSMRVLLDFTGISLGVRGMYLRASYWYIRGFDIKGAGDNGMMISGSNNIVEYCSFLENQDTGLQLGGGASDNQIINCDSYFNRDPGQGNADGFAPKLDVGTGNYFYGCRAWQNSDDGWDGYLRPADNMTTTLENCWSFMNGYLKDGNYSTGNGNGFKMGGGDTSNIDSLRHNMILKQCLAFDNRVKGFDQNNNRGSMTLLNCTGFRNISNNYKISAFIRSTSTLIVQNCVSLMGVVSLAGFAIQETNSWLSPFVVTETDFVSIDTAGVRGPRKADGSLPDVAFMHLAAGSDLVDAGTDVGLPYNGTAPDLGAFELTLPDDVTGNEAIPTVFALYQNYPNPFNPNTSIGFQLPSETHVSCKIYDVLGREVAVLISGKVRAGFTSIDWNASSLPSGIYFYYLEATSVSEPRHSFRQVRKMVFIQ